MELVSASRSGLLSSLGYRRQQPFLWVRRCTSSADVGGHSTTADSVVLQTSESGPSSSHCPSSGCSCAVHYVGRLFDTKTGATGRIFDSTRDIVEGRHVGGTDEPFEFILGQDPSEWIVGMDVGVSLLNHGETAEFVVGPELAWGEAGHGAHVGPACWIHLTVTLLAWKEIFPQFPSPAQLAAARKRREMQTALDIQRPIHEELERRMRLANADRVRGNELVADAQRSIRSGDKAGTRELWDRASREYDGAFSRLCFETTDFLDRMSTADRASVLALKRVLHLNRSLTKMRAGRLKDAVWDSSRAIDLSRGVVTQITSEVTGQNHEVELDTNLVHLSKALRRRCKAQLMLAQEEIAKEQQGQFWTIDKAAQFLGAARKDLQQARFALCGEIGGGTPSNTTSAPSEAVPPKIILNLERRASKLSKLLRRHQRRYDRQERHLYRGMMAGLEAEAEAEAARGDDVPIGDAGKTEGDMGGWVGANAAAEADAFDGMPPLDSSDSDA